jgi:hypothetical protein
LNFWHVCGGIRECKEETISEADQRIIRLSLSFPSENITAEAITEFT